MSGRLWLLVRKEARQEAWILVGMALVLAIIVGLRWLLGRNADRAPSDVEVARTIITLFVPLAALVLGHRLVVREYQARTQLFLEALPLRRSELVTVKYVFGLALLGGFGLTTLTVVAIAAGEGSLRFLLIAGLRTLGYVTAWWSLFFSVGLLGRLRVPAYITLALGLVALAWLASFDLARFGPFALIDFTFSYERTRFPWRAFAETAAVSGGLLVPGFFVALGYEGSLAEMLSRRATGREVTAVSALLLAEFMGVSWAATKRKQPPFEFTSPQVVVRRSPHIAIMYAFPELEPKGRELLRSLESLAARAHEELLLREWPELSVAHNSLLKGDEVRHAPSSRDMLMFEVNLGARDFSALALLTDVAHAALSRASSGRLAFEPNHWLLDGFSTTLALETSGQNVDLFWLRAAVALRHLPHNEKAIVEWDQTMERVGEGEANALAFALLDFVRQRHGPRVALELIRSTVDGHATGTFALPARRDRRFEQLTHETILAFVVAFREELARRLRDPARAALLATVPTDQGALGIEQGGLGPEIVYGVSGASIARERRCTLLHGLLRPYDIYYPSQQLTREPFRIEPEAVRGGGRLRGRYALGQRIYAAIECEVPELAARERLRVERFGAP